MAYAQQFLLVIVLVIVKSKSIEQKKYNQSSKIALFILSSAYVSKFFPLKRFRFPLQASPLTENTLSTGADDAGTANNYVTLHAKRYHLVQY